MGVGWHGAQLASLKWPEDADAGKNSTAIDYEFINLKTHPWSIFMRTNMATCVKCGRPIGLIEYVSGDSKQQGLCRSCRTTGDKWCKDCVHMLAMRDGETSVLRCIKFGYDLSKRKDWTCANDCEAYAARVLDKNPERARVYSSSHE